MNPGNGQYTEKGFYNVKQGEKNKSGHLGTNYSRHIPALSCMGYHIKKNFIIGKYFKYIF